MSQHEISAGEIKEALSRVAAFKFVGVVAEWRLSICLFNLVQTGERFVTDSQLKNTRPTSRRRERAGSPDYDVAALGPAYSDRADERVFAYAAERFRQDKARHGIDEHSCRNVSAGEARGIVGRAKARQGRALGARRRPTKSRPAHKEGLRR